MSIKAIPTMYKGIRFKSRLEAKYAKLFDKYNVKWKYEPRRHNYGEIGYGTGKHQVYYTPDFLLENKYWFEVKRSLDAISDSSKEMFFTLSHKLFFGINFYPESEPDDIFFFRNTYLKHDGYTEYVADEGTTSMSFIKFIDMIKNDS